RMRTLGSRSSWAAIRPFQPTLITRRAVPIWRCSISSPTESASRSRRRSKLVWEVPIRTLQSLMAATLLLSAFTPAYGQTPPSPSQVPAQAPAAPAATEPAKDAPPAAEAGAPSTVSVDQSFVLGVGDVVDVGVIGRTDFNTRQKIT